MKILSLLLAVFLFSAASCDKSLPEVKTKDDVKIDDAKTEKIEPTKVASSKANDELKPIDIGPDAPAIYFLSGLKGYTEPCGCTLDIKLGGIDRIVAFFEDTKAFHPQRMTAHVGDLFFENEVAEENRPAEEARVELIIESLKKIGVRVSVPGPKDFALGSDFFLKSAKKAEIEILAQNISIKGKSIPASTILTMGDKKVGFVGIAQEKLFEKIEDLKVQKPNTKQALKEIASAEVKVLLASGDDTFGRSHAEGFDFVVIGRPRETDQTDLVKGAWTLEPYDQGRYIGVLKVYNTDKKGAFDNANKTSKSVLEKIEKQLARVEKQIDSIEDKTSDFYKNLVAKKKGLEVEHARMKSAKIEISEKAPSFIWQAIAMKPGYRNDSEFENKRKAYNKELKKLSGMVERKVVPLGKDDVEYVGSNQCMTCHVNQGEAWKASRHGDAFATLEKRDKEFDHKCIGCHTVGYEKPGGSVIGKLNYKSEISYKTQSRSIEKDLKNVGCENCHGPGGQHILIPSKQNIAPKPTVDACMECHVPEHSPKFDFDSYVKKIIVPGHGLPK